MFMLLVICQTLTADEKDQRTVLGLPDAVSHFKQPFSAASMTVNCASMRK